MSGFAGIIRLDHFRGFAAYWEVPASEETAIHGRWVPGPGRALFDAIRAAISDVRLVAGVGLDQMSRVDDEMSLTFGVRLDASRHACPPGSASTAAAPPRS